MDGSRGENRSGSWGRRSGDDRSGTRSRGRWREDAAGLDVGVEGGVALAGDLLLGGVGFGDGGGEAGSGCWWQGGRGGIGGRSVVGVEARVVGDVGEEVTNCVWTSRLGRLLLLLLGLLETRLEDAWMGNDDDCRRGAICWKDVLCLYSRGESSQRVVVAIIQGHGRLRGDVRERRRTGRGSRSRNLRRSWDLSMNLSSSRNRSMSVSMSRSMS